MPRGKPVETAFHRSNWLMAIDSSSFLSRNNLASAALRFLKSIRRFSINSVLSERSAAVREAPAAGACARPPALAGPAQAFQPSHVFPALRLRTAALGAATRRPLVPSPENANAPEPAKLLRVADPHSFFVPPGTTENSPAIHRWVSVVCQSRVPPGTKDSFATFCRPCGA